MLIKKPTYKKERELWRNGLNNIVGADEVGRGSWAGPVVAAAVILQPGVYLPKVKDSKKLSPKMREKLYFDISKKAKAIGVGVVEHTIVDSDGIIGATRKAFLKAIDNIGFEVDYIFVDGPTFFVHNKPIEFIKKGDNIVKSIAAASIVAKVTRDNIMMDYHKKFPHYAFDKHKGYGTKEHKEMIEKHGVCPWHRKSYKPVMGMMNNKH